MTQEASGRLASRRNLLIGLGLGVVGAGALAAPSLRLSWSAVASRRGGGWWDRMFVSLRHGGVQDWSGVVGESFTVAGELGESSLKLVSVKALKASGRRPRHIARAHAFVVIFESSADGAPAGDRIYTLSHRSHPPLDIYMSERVDRPGKVRLEAVFN